MQDWQDALLVYSTESGKIKPEPKEQARSVSSDGVVRIHRETKGRKGKEKMWLRRRSERRCH